MPARDHCPLPGVYSSFDISPWAGADVFTVGIAGAPTVTVPAMGSGDLGDPDQPGEGEYLDVIHAMTGYGSVEGLGTRLTTAWASLGRAGTITVDLDEGDRVRVALAGAPTTLELTPAGVDVLGLGMGGIEVDNGESVSAGSDWLRGVTSDIAVLTIGDGVGTEVIALGRVQDVRIMIREVGEPGDLDDTGVWTLETDDETVKFGVTADGRAWWATSRVGALTGMTWESTSFRDRLGFTGDESITPWLGGVIRGQTAPHPLPGVIHPTRPLRRQVPRAEAVGEELRLVGGGYSSISVHTVRGWRVEMWVDGPLDSGIDAHRHWIDMMTDPALCTPGRRITLYQDVGDSRRALDPRSVNVDQPAYDILYTSELGPYRGRIVGFVNPSTGRDIEAEQEGRFRRRYLVSFVMDQE